MHAGSRTFMASFHAASWTNSGQPVDLFYISSASGAPFQVIEARVGQLQYVEADDAEAFGLWMACATGASSGGTSVTPIGLSEALGGASPSALTVQYRATTIAPGATANKSMQDVWHVLNPFVYQPPEDARPSFAGSSHFVFRLVPLTTSTRSFSSSLWASIVWEEL